MNLQKMSHNLNSDCPPPHLPTLGSNALSVAYHLELTTLLGREGASVKRNVTLPLGQVEFLAHIYVYIHVQPKLST